MMLMWLLSALSVLLATASAQSVSGLTFDARDVVTMLWGFEGAVPARYDIWLCAGDESIGLYVRHPTLFRTLRLNLAAY